MRRHTALHISPVRAGENPINYAYFYQQLVAKMPYPGVHQDGLRRITGGHDFGVANRAAGLHQGTDAGLQRQGWTIGKWEKSVRNQEAIAQL